MNKFDKLCALLAIPLGGILMVFGVIGFFVGFHFNVVLPAGLGGIPFFLGWVMCVTLIKFWKRSRFERQLDYCALSQKFLDFQSHHPEFVGSPIELQRRAFQQWLDRN